MVFQLPWERRFVTLKKGWLVDDEGNPVTITSLMNRLKAMKLFSSPRGADETLRLRLVFHQQGMAVDANVARPCGKQIANLENEKSESESDIPERQESEREDTNITAKRPQKRTREVLSDDELELDQRESHDHRCLLLTNYSLLAPAHRAPLLSDHFEVEDANITYTSRKLEYIARYTTSTKGGEPVLSRDYSPAEILIADNWTHDMLNGIDRKDGGSFIGKGAYKFGVLVSSICLSTDY